ncbi:16747_t:CDS:2 [Acaulospora colombiana]|uniref:16747_t:CDS:1 n=1 Tax=Acaulospora colombiana TaxID=27376 RepID=A0ACA9N0S5_9GLOM|nr:16747_t:CDS:2 [Acaulospora colombiana]
MLAPATPALLYAPSHFTLVSKNVAEQQDSSFRVQSYLEEVTRASYEVATSLLCSSILAGRTSESDEYGDVGIWVGKLPDRDPQEVLRNLGLADWIESKGGKIVQAKASPSPLPASLTSTSGPLSPVAETPKIHMESLSKLLNNLESTLEFRVEGLGGGIVLYFMVGQLSEHNGGFDRDDGYAGLLGVGVMTDMDD